MVMNELGMDKALGLNPYSPTELSGAVEDIAREKPIGKKEIAKAVETLKKYKDGKTNLESMIVENEEWYRMRHWDYVKKTSSGVDNERPEPSSAWLFNSLVNKHADAMDNYPEPNVLPREKNDEEAADTLSDVIPVILERNNFETTYSNAWWYKLKHGTSAYGVFWNTQLENGLGDVDIKEIDLLNIFWEAGITDIQESRNLFIISLKDKDLLEQQYPELEKKLGASVIDVKQYIYDDTVDVSDKAVVVDWYYKKSRPVNELGISGGTILHYAKFVGDTLLFASENEPENYPNGWYEHGMYPIAFDVLFPVAGTPFGFGYLNIMKDTQMYIDKLSQLTLEHAAMAARPRYWAKEDMGINEKEFLDLSKSIVHVQGNIDEEKLRPIDVPNMPSYLLNLYQMKIDELKETSSNRDVSQGGTGSGVTAAAAIAALQEAGNKTSRDMISASYRTYTKINYMVIELIRQFYDESRSFRITGKNGEQRFTTLNNAQLKGETLDPAFAGQQMMPDYMPSMRKPVFDIVIKPQRRSAYSRLSQNELAKELYGLGLFNPENAEQAMTTLDMMSFDGDDDIRQKVAQGHTYLNMIKGLQVQLQKVSEVVYALTGRDVMAMMNGGQQPQQTAPQPAPQGSRDTTGGKQPAEERTATTSYGEKLAARATPKMGE